MNIHGLKTWTKEFKAVRDGIKTFEVRVNDREYQPGDILVLREWSPKPGAGCSDSWRYTGEVVAVRVTYLMTGKFGLPGILCVMAVERI